MFSIDYQEAAMDSTKFFICFLFSFFSFLFSDLQGQSVDFKSSNLPIVIINTNNLPVPSEDRIVAHMDIIWDEYGERNFLTDSTRNYNGRIEIELHGQSSLSFPKKSYRIETQDSMGNNNNVSLLDMPAEND